MACPLRVVLALGSCVVLGFVSALPTHYTVLYPTVLIKANKSCYEAVSRNWTRSKLLALTQVHTQP